MLPDRVSNPGPLTYESGALPIALRGPAMMHKAKRPSNYFFNYFTYNQAEQIKKRVICVQILLEIHLTERGRFHFQGRTTFYTPVLVTPSRHMTSK